MKEEWLNHMRNQLEEHRESPSEDLWEDIEAQLFPSEEDSKIILPKITKSNNILVKNNTIWKMAAAVLLLIAVGAGLWQWNDDPHAKVFAKNETDENVLKGTISDLNKDNSLDIQPSNQIAHEIGNYELKQRENTKIYSQDSTIDNVNASSDIKLENLKDVGNTKVLNGVSDQTFKDQFVINESKKDEVVNEGKDSQREDEFERKNVLETLKNEIQSLQSSKHKTSKWFAALHTSGFGISGDNTAEGYVSISKDYMSTESMILAQNVLHNKDFVNIIHSNQDKDVETQIKHRTPISLGMQFQYQLNDKWALVSGGQYTHLVSDLTSGTKDYYIKNEQIIEYIGIPVSLQYHFMDRETWSTYIAMGGQIDFPLEARLKTSYFNNGITNKEGNRELVGLKTQFSTTFGFGLEHRVLNKLFVYGEPSVVYYLDNGSELNSIYKEKPLNFHFKLGLKWKLNNH